MKKGKWLKLTDWPNDAIWEGSVIRAYLSSLGEYVDFLVFSPNEQGCGKGLVYTTSYHAGKVYLLFPEESSPPGSDSLARDWLITNWTKYVDAEGDLHKVYVAERYPDATDPSKA